MLKTYSPLTLLLLLGILGFSACGDDDDNNTNNPVIGTITDIVEDAPNFTVLRDALNATELGGRLDAPTIQYTVFAPTDEAFAAAGIDVGSLSEEELTNILNYHVIQGTGFRTTADFAEGDSEEGSRNTQAPADNNLPLSINRSGETITINGVATAVGNPIIAVNGYIYPIDQVLIPPTLLDRATRAGNFTTLLSLLERTGLDDVLSGEGDFTVFAPTDAAFTAAGINAGLLTDEQVTNLLLYHVLGMSVVAADIPAGQSFQMTLNTAASPDSSNLSLFIDNGSSVTLNGGATVVATDIFGTNGVIHPIDMVLDPEDATIVNFAVLADELDSLVLALTATDLVDDLMGDGPFTVFAPVNSAFAAAADTIATLSGDTLTQVLLYHVVSGANVTSDQLMNGMNITTASTLSGNLSVSIQQDADGNDLPPVLVTPDGTNVNFVTTDIQATNGVIHLIDAVLLPDLD